MNATPIFCYGRARAAKSRSILLNFRSAVAGLTRSCRFAARVDDERGHFPASGATPRFWRLPSSPPSRRESLRCERFVYGAAFAISVRADGRRARPASGRARKLMSLCCRSACRGSAPASASTRCRRSSSSSSISAAAAASLYGLGYGRTSAPERVLPFFPAFLAGMNLVLLADDAYTFLVSWEFMSLGLVGAGDGPSPRSRQRARRLRLHRDGELRHAGAAARLRPAGGPGRRLCLRRDARNDA